MACKICHHPELADIERELAEGARYHSIAKWYFCDRHAVRYHAERCMPEKLKTRRFEVEKRRLNDQLDRLGARVEKQKRSNTERLKRSVVKDLIRTLDAEKPHIPHN